VETDIVRAPGTADMFGSFSGKRIAGDHFRNHQTGAVLVGKGSKGLVGHP